MRINCIDYAINLLVQILSIIFLKHKRLVYSYWPIFGGERLLLGLTLGVISMTMLACGLSLAFGLRPAVLWAVVTLAVGAALTFWPGKLRLLSSLQRRIPSPARLPKQFSKTDLYGLAVFLASAAFFRMFTTPTSRCGRFCSTCRGVIPISAT